MEKVKLEDKLEVTPEEAESLRQQRCLDAVNAVLKEHGYNLGVNNQIVLTRQEVK